ncbi:MAG: glycosyltransferase family 4 protein, partial [Candidatus Binatia bacterium]
MTRPKRVWEISASYFLRDPRVRREAEALADAGWQVDVICLRAPGEPATGELGAIRIRRLPLARRRGSKARYLLEYGAFFAAASALLTRNHLRRRYDLIHVHNMPDLLVFAAWLPKLTGTPIVLDVHDPMPEVFQARFGLAPGHPFSRALRWQERLSFSFADHLITTHELIRQLYARSAPPSKMSAVMNVPDPKLFEPIRNRAPQRRFTLVYTGTVTAPYGLDVAVHAVAKLRTEIPDVRLRIIGDGDDLERVKQLSANLNLAGHVEFVPPVTLDRIPGILSAADVSLVPHRDDPIMPWCFSTKLVEALRVGLPVICARAKALTHYFDDTMVAYVEPGNADDLAAQALRYHRDPALGARMVGNARRFFAEHSWEHERSRFY